MKKFMRSVWNNEFYQGGIVLTLGGFIVNLMNYFFSFLTAKSLGPNGFGEVTALLSYVSVISLPISVLTSIIIQKISAAGVTRTQYALSLEHLFVSKTRNILLIVIPLLLIIPLLPRLTNLSFLSSYILVPLLILSFLGSFYGAANQGLRLFFLITCFSIGAAAFKLTGAVVTFFGVHSILVILIFLLISALFSFITSYILFHTKSGKNNNQSIRKIERSIFSIFFSKQFLLFAFSISGLALFGTIDILFVKKFFSAEVTGIYSSWSLLAKIILYAVGPLISLSFIFFSSTDTEKKQKMSLFIAMVSLVIIGFISYFIYTRYAIVVINLFFGNRFDAVIQYIGLASIFGSLYAAITFFNNYFLSKKSLASLILPFGLPIYISFLIFIPRHLFNIMELNIYFSASVICIYFVVFVFAGILSVKKK